MLLGKDLPVDGQHVLSADGYYSSGRAAFHAILSSIAGRAEPMVLLPSYLCTSITKTVMETGWTYKFYGLRSDLYPDTQSIIENLENNEAPAVLLINYFGLLNLDKVVTELRQQYPHAVIILDDVQNLYGFGQEPDFDFCFTSLRKWLPVPDGGLVKLGSMRKDTVLSIYDEELSFTEYKLAGNLLKSFPQVISDELCLRLLGQGEMLLDKKYLGDMSVAAEMLLRELDLHSAAQQRQVNAAVLHQGLTELGIEHLYQPGAVQLFVPIVLSPEQRSSVRRGMFQEQIFCPVHWPKEGEGLCGDSFLYDTELSMICDQRYDEKDMQRQLSVFSRFV